MPPNVAERASWKNQPLPAARARLDYRRTFDRDEHARVVRGLVPREMEDKWFVFYEAPQLFFHRSWTGVCVYQVQLRPEGDGSAIEEAWVNRAPEQYSATDDAHDVALLGFLVEALLLGRDVPFPVRGTVDPDKAGVLKHHVVGHGRPNDEE